MSTIFNFEYEFIPKSVTKATEIVARFYRLNSEDEAANNSALSLLIPGSVSSRYADSSGRRLTKTLVPNLNISFSIPNSTFGSDCDFQRKATANGCANGFDGSIIDVVNLGWGAKISIIFYTPSESSADEPYFYKIVVPSKAEISELSLTNAVKLDEDVVSGSLKVVGGEIFQRLFGVFAFPVTLFFSGIPSAGDPPYLESLLTQVEDSILTKRLFPYQSFEGHFKQASTSVSSQIDLITHLSYGELLEKINAHKMSIYVGGRPGTELVVEGLTIQ